MAANDLTPDAMINALTKMTDDQIGKFAGQLGTLITRVQKAQEDQRRCEILTAELKAKYGACPCGNTTCVAAFEQITVASLRIGVPRYGDTPEPRLLITDSENQDKCGPLATSDDLWLFCGTEGCAGIHVPDGRKRISWE